MLLFGHGTHWRLWCQGIPSAEQLEGEQCIPCSFCRQRVRKTSKTINTCRFVFHFCSNRCSRNLLNSYSRYEEVYHLCNWINHFILWFYALHRCPCSYPCQSDNTIYRHWWPTTTIVPFTRYMSKSATGCKKH